MTKKTYYFKFLPPLSERTVKGGFMKQRPFIYWSLYFFSGLIILSLMNPLFSSRAPAVDPIVGLSIDEEMIVQSNKVKGFNFRSSHLKVLDKSTDKAFVKNIIQIFSLLFLLSLPFVLWNRILITSKDGSKKPNLTLIKGGKESIGQKEESPESDREDDNKDDGDDDKKNAA